VNPVHPVEPLGARSLRTLLGVFVAAVSGLAIALTMTGNARAEPTPGELERQIDVAWNSLEPVIEQHNQVRAELADNRAKVAALTEQIQPLQVQIDAVNEKIAALSVQQYKTGPTGAINALLASGSSTHLPDQLARIEMVARRHGQAIADVVALKKQYDELKRPLDQLVDKLAAQEADLAQKKVQIDAEIKRLNEMRLQAYGTTGGTGALRPAPCPSTYPGGPAAIAARTACAQIGKPYVFGSGGPNSFDCSGLTAYAWGAAGVKLRHFTRWQWEDTKSVGRPELRPGDLVFYYSDLHHVGMYVGEGWLVHASRAGEPVKMKRVDDGPIAGYRRPG
jgi:peptidoglycan DL-endopeptidase CwlO